MVVVMAPDEGGAVEGGAVAVNDLLGKAVELLDIKIWSLILKTDHSTLKHGCRFEATA